MKSRKVLAAALAVVVTLSVFTAPVIAAGKKATANEVYDQKTLYKLESAVDSKAKVRDLKAVKKSRIASAAASSAPADYPTRKGVILVTKDLYKGLIPLGHAAIVYSETQVVESVINGVVMGKNDWWSSKDTSAAGSVSSTTTAQDAAAAEWCKSKLGTPYNFNYFDTGTRKAFYCSQLVYASYLDNYGVNLNTNAFNISGLGNPVHPLELLSNSFVSMIYKNNW